MHRHDACVAIARLRRVKSIFVLDDDEAQAGLLAAILEDTGAATVRAFSDPLRALAALDDEGADLLVADIAMPRMDGLDLVQCARLRRPELKVILVSGAPHGAELARQIGLPFLGKPIDIEALRDAARTALQ